MSDAPGFDMALLEGKDRAELAAIAEQLGQKPGARAKKADIVSLILRLVGADDGDAEAEAATPAAADGGAETAAEEPGGDAPSDDVAASAEAGSDAAGDATGDGTDADDAAPGRRGGGRNQGGGQQGRTQDQGGDQQGRGQQGRNQDQGGGQQGRGQDQGGDDANEPNGNQRDPNEQQEGEAESGNRRRRRRGRDRDRRPDDDQAPIEPIEVEGMVDLREEGYGFLRLHGYLPSRDDAYISVKQTRQFGLRTGDTVRGKSRPPARNEKNPALLQVDSVNGYEAHNQAPRPRFDELTARFPLERLTLELADDPSNATARAIDLLAPIGKGTRGLIASPPKAGKTTAIKQIVRALEVNHPEIELFVVLIDERPEEITEMKRWLLRGSVAASAVDRPADEHTAVAELVVEKAKRLVESGKDVVVVLDGLTRLARAYDLVAPAGGRILAGGLDASAVFPTKQLFGAARNAEEGGSLTILATAVVGTGSATDEAIFESFAGSENQELKLDRTLADRHLFPAIDIEASSTRHADLLLDKGEVASVASLRQLLGARIAESGSAAGLELLLERLAGSKSNADLLTKVAKG